MPLFDYICDRCGNRFEELVSTASAEVRCKTCREPARKLPSAFAVSHASAPARAPGGGG